MTAGKVVADNEAKLNKVQSRSKRTDGGQHSKRSTPSQMRANQQQKSSNNQQTSISKNQNKTSQSPNNKLHQSQTSTSSDTNSKMCLSLDEFSKKAQELKTEISKTLAVQSDVPSVDQTQTMSELRETMVKLSTEASNMDKQAPAGLVASPRAVADDRLEGNVLSDTIKIESSPENQDKALATDRLSSHQKSATGDAIDNPEPKSHEDPLPRAFKSDDKLLATLDRLTLEPNVEKLSLNETQCSRSICSTEIGGNIEASCANPLSNNFELLEAKLDNETKYLALASSLQRHFVNEPQALEAICRKMISLSDQNEQALISCRDLREENKKLLLIRGKLENLCRELQKSNNSIRIESLDLIKSEQSRAKEQTSKIQSTLSGVIKLFDENQQRNSLLRQENSDLQAKLKSLLEHCDNWEKSVDSVLKQRDIENRLLKTELAKANLLKNEEREKFLGEKQELLRLLSMMQEQQHRIEGQEAKLRTDLTNYASKYDECQSVIKNGMSKFRDESKRMLKQLEKSRHDYMILLGKYESSNKTIVKLLEEKRTWSESMLGANRKIETLEKLCRALRSGERSGKSEGTTKHETTESDPSALPPNGLPTADPNRDDKLEKCESHPSGAPVASGNKTNSCENKAASGSGDHQSDLVSAVNTITADDVSSAPATGQTESTEPRPQPT